MKDNSSVHHNSCSFPQIGSIISPGILFVNHFVTERKQVASIRNDVCKGIPLQFLAQLI